MPKPRRNSKPNGRAKRSVKPKKPARPKKRIDRPKGHKSIEELAREQGKELRPWTDEDFRQMVELGKGLFRSPKELDEFIAGIYERRRQNRGK